MATNIFRTQFNNAFATTSNFLCRIPSQVDQFTIGKGSRYLTNLATHLCSQYVPTKYQNAEFSGWFRSIFLTAVGHFGDASATTVSDLKARTLLTKPVEFLISSTMLTSRRVYDAVAQNFHVEVDAQRLVVSTYNEAIYHCNPGSDPAGSKKVFRDSLPAIFEKKIQTNRLTMAEFASRVSEIALPEVFEQFGRIFLTAAVCSYMTNSSFLSTCTTVTIINTSVGLGANQNKFVKGIAAAVPPVWYLLSSEPHFWSTLFSVAHLSVWYGLIANEKTSTLGEYKPPETSVETANLMANLEGDILKKVDQILKPENPSQAGWSNGAIDALKKALQKIPVSPYPFMAFSNTASPHSQPQADPNPTVTRGSTSRGVRFEDSGKKPEKLPFEDAEQARKDYESAHKGFDKHAKYWDLRMKEYASKIKYYLDNRSIGKAVTCIEYYEQARFEYLKLNDTVTNFNRIKTDTLSRLREKLQDKKFQNEQEALKDIIAAVNKQTHPRDV